MTDKQTTGNQPCTLLHLERRHGPRKNWCGTNVCRNNPGLGLTKLKEHLPGEIEVAFTDDAATITAGFKIVVGGNTFRPDEKITIRKNDGRHSLSISGVIYVATVN